MKNPAAALSPRHRAIHSVFVSDGREAKIGELVITLDRGNITASHLPSPGFPQAEVLPVREVLADLEYLRAAGATVVLLTVSSGGGQFAASLALMNAIRDLSAGGCKVVVHVDNAVASTSTWWPLAADYVALAPGARFLIHGATEGGRSGRVLDARDPTYRAIFAMYRTHTLVTDGPLTRALSLIENDRGDPEAVELQAAEAVALAFADGIATRGEVLAAALALAAGEALPAQRRALLVHRGDLPQYAAELAALRTFTARDLRDPRTA